MADLNAFAWPVARLGEALEHLARRSGLAPAPDDVPAPPAGPANGEPFARWLEAVSERVGLEIEPAAIAYADVDRFLDTTGFALLPLPAPDASRFLVLLGATRRTVRVLGPDHRCRRLRRATVRAMLCRDLEVSRAAEIDRWLEEAQIPCRRRVRARAALLRDRLGPAQLDGGWRLRLSSGASFWRQMRDRGLAGQLAMLVGIHVVHYALWLLAWGAIGAGALQGRWGSGWLAAWGLLLLVLVGVRSWATGLQGSLASGAGALLKRRLLLGALKLSPDEIAGDGIGRGVGRVIESEAVESLALGGGLLGLVAGVELALTTVVLGAGAGGWPQASLLVGWVALAGLLGWGCHRRRRRWTERRLDLTHDLIEGMAGHRTRVVQQAPERWHENEDRALDRYLAESRALDRTTATLLVVAPRGWLVAGLIGLGPIMVAGHGTPATLAVGLGGIVLAYRALEKLVTGLSHLAGAAIAWERVAPLFRAAARSERGGDPNFAAMPASSSPAAPDEAPLVEARGLVFRYLDRADPVLKHCHLQVHAGERILLEGPSGGGKSTLAALLADLRRPESGLLLLRGLDAPTLGLAGWRRRVVAAPQFHQNHVLAETFAFNLLMGRRWPPQLEDLAEAETVCRELGLGNLLDRMPAGMMQQVGETGWPLSHGERSRLYIARALLQRAELIVLDESFAALDPENLRRALRCVFERAATLLVIAHP